MYEKSGCKKIGNFEKSILEGKGKLVEWDQTEFVGNFKNGKLDGIVWSDNYALEYRDNKSYSPYDP